jgi:predicted GNAT family acetyltransferase
MKKKSIKMKDATLRTATSEEQLEILNANHSSWGFQFPLKTYIERESLLGSLPFSSDRRCHVLASPTKVLASCESYTRPCTIILDGKSVSGTCWAIASVFTTPENRGKGYASRMMELVLKSCKESGCIASILYSDIGPVFYTRLGWKLYPCVSAFIAVELWEYADEGGSAAPVKLSPGGLKEIINMPRESSLGNSFSMPLTQEAVDWLFARSTHYAGVKEIDVPDVCGFRVDSDFGIDIFLTPQSCSSLIFRMPK